jgi:hypothetical protein
MSGLSNIPVQAARIYIRLGLDAFACSIWAFACETSRVFVVRKLVFYCHRLQLASKTKECAMEHKIG